MGMRKGFPLTPRQPWNVMCNVSHRYARKSNLSGIWRTFGNAGAFVTRSLPFISKTAEHLQLVKLARVLVRLDDVARIIVNANHGGI
jgi:hypothetical protein